jgi:phage terminase large subunit-like protein
MAKRKAASSTAPANDVEATRWAPLLEPDRIPKRWLEVLRRIPAYDPLRDAAGYRFDPAAAELAIAFFAECLQHVEGDLAGQPFVLEPWEEAIIANLFGWYGIDRLGRVVRRYREVFLYVPRKNGKTPLVAGIGLTVLFTDEEAGQQNYLAAADREQAALAFRHAKGMVEREPELKARCKIFGGNAQAGQSRSIFRPDTGSFLRVIPADAATQHGGNTHLAIIDELHTQPNRDLVDVLRTSMASANRKQPLFIYVTTADVVRPSICNEVYDYACHVRDGIIDNPRFLPVIYETKPDDDWKDPKVWAQANPNLGVSVSVDYLEAECKRAQENPAQENVYKRLHLNLRTEQSVRAVPMDKWDACAAGVDDPKAWRANMLAKVAGKPCFAGLDLGNISDLTALVRLWELPTDENQDHSTWLAIPDFWVPRDTARLRERRDRVPYEQWIRDGWIRPTEGDVTDYDQIRADVNEIFAATWVQKLAVDRLFQGVQLCTQLMSDGIPLDSFGQGFFSMAAPTKTFLEIVKQLRLLHGKHPVLRWMAANLATRSDPAGCLKPDKEKSADKIDGIVALIMSLGLAIKAAAGSVYDERGVEVI